MKAIRRLKDEHDLIERGLDLLEQSQVLVESNQPVPEAFLKWIPQFFSQFADKCHHAKEEDLFFPLLKERGIPQEGGPIGVMLHEHDQGRDCVGRMRDASEQSEFDAASFVTAAKEFIPLLRQHIFKENNILFRMAENVMSETDDNEIDGKFSSVETERKLVGLHQRFETEISRWEESMK